MPVSGVLSNGGGLESYRVGKRPARKEAEPAKRADTFAEAEEQSAAPAEESETLQDLPSQDEPSSEDGYIDYGLPDDLADLLRAAAKPGRSSGE
jgi:hypothetical protein